MEKLVLLRPKTLVDNRSIEAREKFLSAFSVRSVRAAVEEKVVRFSLYC